MIRGMFRTFGMEESRRDDYDMDACLEHSEEELQESFLEFYHDVLPEFRSIGKVVQFKVGRDQESQYVYMHLYTTVSYLKESDFLMSPCLHVYEKL